MATPIQAAWKIKPPFGTRINRGHYLARGLVGRWLMNENGGTELRDLIGSNHLTFVNGTKWTGSMRGYVPLFDGTNDYAADTSTSGLPATDGVMTLSAWGLTGTTTGTHNLIVLNNDPVGASAQTRSIQIELRSSTIRASRNGGTLVVNSAFTPTLGVWFHMVFTNDGTTRRLYINGVERANSTSTMDSGSSSVLYLGTYDDTSLDETWNGLIDDVRIYNRPVSAPEVWQLYTNQYADMVPSPPSVKYFISAGGGVFLLSADPGSYALTGQAATPLAARLLSLDAGSYAITGNAANLLRGAAIVASAGSYAIVGSAADVLATRTLTAAPGSYAVTGAAAQALAARLLTLDPGAYIVTGAAAELLALGAYSLTAEPGVYQLTGAVANLLAGRLLDASSGVYLVTGRTAELLTTRLLDAAPGSYAVVGATTTLVFSSEILSPATLTLTESEPCTLALTESQPCTLALTESAPVTLTLTESLVN